MKKNISPAVTVRCYCPLRSSLFLLLFTVTVSLTSYAQTVISVEIRPRAEFRHGFKSLMAPDQQAASFIEQRSRLNLYYQSEKITTSIRLQDIRFWGETGQINKSDNMFSVHEAWAQYAFNKKWSLRVGRQELVYDDHRILGNLDWAAQGRSHDALKLMYFDSIWTLHAVVAYNQNSNIPEPAKLSDNFYTAPGGFGVVGGGQPNYKYMQMFWGDRKFGKFYTSWLLLNTGWQMPDTTINNLATAGINPTFAFSNKIKLVGSGYYQFGYDRSDARVRSYLFSIALNLNLPKSTYFFGYDRLSGTGADKTHSTTFDPLFGTHHKFYGLMDYFYVGNPHAQGGKTIGIQDLFIRAKHVFGAKTSLSSELHHFLAAVSVVDPSDATKNLSSSLGTEFDLVLQHAFHKDFVINLGYSQMFATKSMEAIKGGDADKLNCWAWLMLTFKPEIFNSALFSKP